MWAFYCETYMRRILLCILDGWGERALDNNNGISGAMHWKRLLHTYPHTFLQASESYVGLPDGQMGNSEVGHMTIGLGRVLTQDLPRIDAAIANNTFTELSAFKDLVERTKAGSNRCHVMGLLSQGGVHSHENHFFYAVHQLANHGITVIVHPFLDGRDTAPQSARESLAKLDALLCDTIKPGFMTGRYFAMDRDNRWDRTQMAYDVFMKGGIIESQPPTFSAALKAAYASTITDEFIKPIAIGDYAGIMPGDTCFMVNFRADRVRQWLSALVLPDFDAFETSSTHLSYILGMRDYSDALSHHISTLFPTIPVSGGLGECIADHSLCQLRIAETEKYAHVTYFFNGGRETPFDGENRIMIPSPNVATYDLAPEMSAGTVTAHVVEALRQKNEHLIVVNYANPDMVGHTGVKGAIKKAITTVDHALSILEKEALQNDWLLIITADHGNVECMTDDAGQPQTAHTCNPVPFLVINGEGTARDTLYFRSDGTLADIAPTILHWLNLPQSIHMSGKVLLNGN